MINGHLKYIKEAQKELTIYSGINALLGWDQMTYMPHSGAAGRAEHQALISTLHHQRLTDDMFYQHTLALTKNDAFFKLSTEDQQIVTRLKKDLDKQRKIPDEYIARQSKSATLAYSAWEQAKNSNNYSHFAPHLQTILDLKKEYISYINISGHPYNSLLDDYEEGMKTTTLNSCFTLLKKELKGLLETITSSVTFEQQIHTKLPELDKKTQQILTMHFLEQMQLPNDRFRTDTSPHPFTTTITPDDVRITTNYDHPNPLFSFHSTIHEAGHALYELNMPKGAYAYTVISDAPSLGLHESQSRFWENMIARSKPFWDFFYPLFKKTARTAFDTISSEQWYRQVNAVSPSLIRVQADELTYCLHIILRYELERQLIEGSVTPKELPDHWNEGMQELLGVTPKNDAEGCLQDMHWSGGDIGYFPTYALGSIYAAQLFDSLKKDEPDIEEKILIGDYTSTKQWLNENIHSYGRMLEADQIIKNATGEGLHPKNYLRYLKEKYLPLYE